MSKIYGIDISKKITPLMVRDAVVECFYQAHCAETGLSSSKHNPANREYCRSIIRKAFDDAGGDFNNPDKNSIIKVLDNLAEFSKNFRDPSVIEKHYKQIMILVDKIT